MPITLGTNVQLGSATLTTGGATALSGGAALTNFCDILENVGASNGMGGFSDNWTVSQGSVPCAVTALTPAVDRVEGDRITAIGIYEFILPDTTTIKPENRIQFAGFTFIIQDRAIPIPTQSTVKVRCRLLE